MNPMVVLYFASKKKETGKFHIIPPPDRGYGVVIVYMKDGDIVGLESTWGSSLDNLERIFEWPKSIVRKYDLGDTPVKVFIPNKELIHKIVFRDLERLKGAGKRLPSEEEIKILLRMSVGTPRVVGVDEVRRIKSSPPKSTFFLQSDYTALSVILGRPVIGFSYGNGIREVDIADFPEKEAKLVTVEHIMALCINLPFFINPRVMDGEEGLKYTKSLINKSSSIWMSVFSTKAGVHVPAVGYKGVFLGIVIKRMGEIQMLPEAFLNKLHELGEFFVRVYEYDAYMYGT